MLLFAGAQGNGFFPAQPSPVTDYTGREDGNIASVNVGRGTGIGRVTGTHYQSIFCMNGIVRYSFNM